MISKLNRTSTATVALLTLVFGAFGCGGPPRKAIADAQSALTDADAAEECAPEEYAAARKMLEKARVASDKEEYDEAKEYAEAAKVLAEKAALKAEENLSECQRRKEAATASADLDDEAPAEPLMEPEFEDDWTLRTVYFQFNAAALSAASQNVLQRNAEWLTKRAEVRVLVEGHCDERGSTEYNLALGEQRAGVVKQFMTRLGVAPERVAVISYGEELPLDNRQTEDAFSRNRRAEFRVQ